MNLTTARIVTVVTVAVAAALNPYGALVDLAIIGAVIVTFDTAKPILKKLKGWKNHNKRRFKAA
jgi:hypothetical protein